MVVSMTTHWLAECQTQEGGNHAGNRPEMRSSWSPHAHSGGWGRASASVPLPAWPGNPVRVPGADQVLPSVLGDSLTLGL